MTNHTSNTETVQRHPVRGALWGLVLGIGAALYTMLFGIFDLFAYPGPIAVVVGGVAVGIAWAYLAPAKRPKNP